ncbi:MAG TPA: tRNA-dihydrouridine synthase family protein [Candidatus Saccharimonadales bacterium]|nr:tRNA-dihydrouridine synthase family protein [Candidatus Saccharimonadales bacterium]
MNKKNFWLELKNKKQPILALAPMAGFTDSAFRQLCKKFGADVLYSEMASATALYYSDYATDKTRRQKMKNATLELLKFNSSKEKYYVVQLFGSNPEHFAVATRIVTQEIRPDGIDINFGCPVSKVIKQGAGSDLMKNLVQARAVIMAVLANTDLPVSIKIRARSGEIDALKFLKNISDLPLAALMIHGRTVNQGFAGEADYQLIKEARRYFSGVILANGGVNDLASAQKMIKTSQADGLGLARGILGRPWLFQEIKNNKENSLSVTEVLKLMLTQAQAQEKLKGAGAIIELRKHLVWYVKSLSGASRLREQLVKVKNLNDLKNIIKDYQTTL